MEGISLRTASAASFSSNGSLIESSHVAAAESRPEAPSMSPQVFELRPWRGQADDFRANAPPHAAGEVVFDANDENSRRVSGRADSTVTVTSHESTVSHLSAQSEAASLSNPASRGTQLLERYRTAIGRPLDKEQAVAAIKLRCAAEVFCEKNELARFTPRISKRGESLRRFKELAAVPVDELLVDIEAHPQLYTRTLLTDLAQHHLLAALSIDVELYRQGIRNAAKYEGLHSVPSRVVSTVAACASAGISALPGSEHALSVGGKVVKVLAHELPPNVINPLLASGLRSAMDVKQTFKRVGGQPVVMQQIATSPDIGKIVRSLKTQRRELTGAIAQFRAAAQTEAGAQQAVGQLVDAFLALHQTAERQYKRRIGLNRTQTYSKGWGMAVNGVAAAGAVVTVTVPVAGQIAGLAILAATIPLQWGAGYLDERRNKHRYNLRANTKWGDFLTEDAARIHFKNLKPEHVSEAALRQAFMTQPELQVAAIREVYEDGLGDCVQEHAELERKIGAMEAAAKMPASALMPHRRKLAELAERIELIKQQVVDFESFDPARWAAIPNDSLIGRCLDDLGHLEKANRRARLRKPSESAQTVQRYVQAFHAGISTGTALPVMDAIATIDSTHAIGDNGHQTGLRAPYEAGALTAGIGGGAVFTAVTGEVRMTKADNKKLLSQTFVSPPQAQQQESRWVFQAGNRRVDLRDTAGYRKHARTNWDALKLLSRAVGHGLVSGPVGLTNLIRAKWWPGGEVLLAKRELREALNALDEAALERKAPPGAGRAATMSAMKDELYDYAAVRRHLGVT